jgi:GH15 family glucan-1,4-alpha-glucosidase
MTSHGPRRFDGYLPIEDYAAIGDSQSLALVGIDGTIDWMCAPQLDSPSLFASLLDPARGGRYVLQPAVPFASERRYLERTNVLETTFETDHGTARVIDALTIDSSQAAPWRELVRQVEGVSGRVPMRLEIRPRFGYGRREARFQRLGQAVVARDGQLQLALRAWDAGALTEQQGALTAGFEVQDGERALLAMVVTDAEPLPVPGREAVERRLRETIHVWREWVGRNSYDGPWREAVERSLLAIRLLADARTGAIAAAGTTSLPEAIGGDRNYDYRFGWVRDACFTLDAVLSVGMDELTQAALQWLLEATLRTHPRVDPVYALGTDVVRTQERLPLDGYRRTGPVHLGNQAGSQLQLGGFGDLVETICLYSDHGHLLGPATGERLADVGALLSRIWKNDDSGLWELGERAHYGTSKLGVWVAFDRLLTLVERGQVPRRAGVHWERDRDEVRRFIERHLFSERKNSYVMKSGSEALDCGMLLAARRRFSEPAGRRINGTIDAIQSELSADGLLYRYSGMEQEENAFLACSFWLAEALALAGRVEEGTELLDTLIGLGNDVGLYSEEMDPSGHAMLGNFPQALSHLSLINAAHTLSDSAAGRHPEHSEAQVSRAATATRSRLQSGGSPSRT